MVFTKDSNADIYRNYYNTIIVKHDNTNNIVTFEYSGGSFVYENVTNFSYDVNQYIITFNYDNYEVNIETFNVYNKFYSFLYLRNIINNYFIKYNFDNKGKIFEIIEKDIENKLDITRNSNGEIILILDNQNNIHTGYINGKVSLIWDYNKLLFKYYKDGELYKIDNDNTGETTDANGKIIQKTESSTTKNDDETITTTISKKLDGNNNIISTNEFIYNSNTGIETYIGKDKDGKITNKFIRQTINNNTITDYYNSDDIVYKTTKIEKNITTSKNKKYTIEYTDNFIVKRIIHYYNDSNVLYKISLETTENKTVQEMYNNLFEELPEVFEMFDLYNNFDIENLEKLANIKYKKNT